LPTYRKLKEGALFIADAHENHNRRNLYEALKQVEEIAPPQLFLMGDIFDLLVGEVDYTRELFAREIHLINRLSLTTETFYFEGNHDFSLEGLFPNVTLFPRSLQPALFEIGNRRVAIAHGDIYENLGYNLYTATIRNKILLTILNALDNRLDRSISTAILERLEQKEQCQKFHGFEHFAQRRQECYDPDLDLIIEGHFHQNYAEDRYINLPSFACHPHLVRLNRENNTLTIK
jgi:UDP-2,3-diacylglucosamine hydrolase